MLLDEMQAVTGLERKTLIRLMHGSLERRSRQRQRGRTYGAEVDDALRVIAESCDHICAERLQPNLVAMAKQLAAHGEPRVSPSLLERLERISIPTVRRISRRVTHDEPHLPRRGPEPANQATRDIPMRRIPWDECEPGHFEIDLAHHCGSDASGSYVHTLQLIDAATGWSERVSLLGGGSIAMQDAFQRILARLPFAVSELHPDNGSEFFNAHQHARTPYAHLAATPSIFPERRDALAALLSQTNPRQLRREIYADLVALFALPCAAPGAPENVLETLAVPIDA